MKCYGVRHSQSNWSRYTSNAAIVDLPESGRLNSALSMYGLALECYGIWHPQSNWGWLVLVVKIVVGERGAAGKVVAGDGRERRAKLDQKELRKLRVLKTKRFRFWCRCWEGREKGLAAQVGQSACGDKVAQRHFVVLVKYVFLGKYVR